MAGGGSSCERNPDVHEDGPPALCRRYTAWRCKAHSDACPSASRSLSSKIAFPRVIRRLPASSGACLTGVLAGDGMRVLDCFWAADSSIAARCACSKCTVRACATAGFCPAALWRAALARISRACARKKLTRPVEPQARASFFETSAFACCGTTCAFLLTGTWVRGRV